MKPFSTTLLFVSISFLFTSAALAQKADEAAIKKALQDAWTVSTAKNADAVKATWLKHPMAVSTFIGRYDYTQVSGWDSIAKSIENNYQKNPKPSRTSFTLRNHRIHTNGKMAFVDYEAVVTPVNSDPNSFPYIPDSLRFRTYQVLEKDNGQWKTLAMINTNPQSYEITHDHVIESDINEIGYRYLFANKLNEAIEVFKLNVKLYPNAWNTYDSLGEAYMAAGNKQLAIENYEKSLQLNPKSESGKAALAKLKQL